MPTPKPALVQRINTEHAAAERSGSQMLDHALRCGDLLAEVKKDLSHGEWLPWLAANFTGSRRTAQNYLRLANAQHDAHFDKATTVRQALLALAPDRERTKRASGLVAVADLKPHPRNYRCHPEDQLAHLRASIREHGMYSPIVAATDGTILAGHGRWAAAKAEGMVKVPVTRLPLDADDPKAIKVLAGDNEFGERATDDPRQLTDLLKEVHAEQDLLGSGYDDSQLANLAFVSRPEDEIADQDAAAHWVGMPAYKPQPVPFKLIVSFEKASDREDFMKLVGCPALTNSVRRTSSIWWPEKPRQAPTVEFVEEAA